MAVHKYYRIALVGLPASERILFKLIFSASARLRGRQYAYALHESDAEPAPDLLIVPAAGVAAQQRGEWDGVPYLRILDHGAEPDTESVLQRPLIATRVIRVLDDVVTRRIASRPETAAGGTVADGSAAADIRSDADTLLIAPVASGSAAHTAIPRSQSESAAALPAGSRALVVDDSSSVRKQLELELALFEVEVDYAVDAGGAFELLETNRYDVAFLDVVLPDGDGFAICKSIKSGCEDTTVIMLTSKATQADRLRGSLAGCDAYLVKPVDRVTFQHTLRNYLPLLEPAQAAQAC